MKLATSAMMPEDFLYLLGGLDSEIDDNYSGYRSYIGSSSSKKPAEFEKQVVDFRAHVQKAVTEADIITLGLGNANFGATFNTRTFCVENGVDVYEESKSLSVNDMIAKDAQ